MLSLPLLPPFLKLQQEGDIVSRKGLGGACLFLLRRGVAITHLYDPRERDILMKRNRCEITGKAKGPGMHCARGGVALIQGHACATQGHGGEV